MKRVSFSRHAMVKVELLQRHGFRVEAAVVKEVVLDPDKVDEGYRGRRVAQKGFDEAHVLRVVYEETDEDITIITLYPGRRERYEKD